MSYVHFVRQVLDVAIARNIKLINERDEARVKLDYVRQDAREWYENWKRCERAREAARKKAHERLGDLDDAESALAGCGIGGIYDEFTGLTDAIMQMAAHIEELEADARLAAHVHELNIGLERQAVRAERQWRREAAQGWSAMLAEARTCAERLKRARQRARGAEALAALVTPELAELLGAMVALAESTHVQVPALLQGPMLRMIDDARALAAKIGEALDDSQA